MPMKVRYTTVNGQVIAENRSGVRKLYVPDPLGNTVAMIDDTQTVTDTFSYWPYGEVASRTGTTETALQYVGTRGYYSGNVGNSYVRARYLNAQLGRWQTQDPISLTSGDITFYRYANGNPTTYIDPTGKNPAIIIGIIACLGAAAYCGWRIYKWRPACTKACVCEASDPYSCVFECIAKKIKEDNPIGTAACVVTIFCACIAFKSIAVCAKLAEIVAE